MQFTDIFIRRPVLATVVSLLILIVGARSLQLLNVREYPQAENAVVTVTTVYTGADAGLVKDFITTRLEREIASADGIDYLESTSLQGVSSIRANLELGYDPNDALTQITSKVNRVRNELPEGSEEPTIDITVGQTTAQMYLSFFSDELESNQITDYLRRVIQPELETIAGVQRARIIGARTFAMRIWLEPARMAAHAISPSDVREVLARNNFLAAVGKTKGQMIAVDLTAATDLHSAEEFRNLVVKEEGGTIVRLRDIANVELGAENYDTSVRFNGKEATFIGLEVLPNANALTVIDKVLERWPELVEQLPEGMEARIPYDATKYIEDSISEVQSTILEAVAIVVLVIFVFLGSLRTIVIPVVAIPLSLVGAGFVMLAMGFSINLLTLLAMVLAIGLVVDDAIVVVENIHRHIEHGEPPFRAAINGARELGTPVIAMTITLVAVYAPVGFMGGLTGSLFTEFAFTLAGAVLISGVVALTLSPMMCSKLLKPESGQGGLAERLDALFERLRGVYQRRLHGALDSLPVIAVFAALILVSCYFLFVTAKSELAPTEDQGIIIASATAQPNASLDQTELYTREMTRIFQSFPETENIFLMNGIGGGGSAASSNSAISGMVFEPWSERERTQMEVMPEVQRKLAGIAGLQVAAFTPPELPGAGQGLPVQFVVKSTGEPRQIHELSGELLRAMRSSGLFAFADSDLKFDKAQVDIRIDRDKAAAIGFDMQALGGDIAAMLGGNFVNRFSMQGRSYKVIPQVRRQFRLNPDQLSDYQVRTASGEMVPLSTIVELEKTVEPRQLNRFQQANAATLSGVPAPGVSMGEALGFLQNKADEILPRGFSVDYSGQARQYVQEGSALMVTFFFALVMIYLVLSAQFESFRDPLIMLVSVPMSISGALIFLSLGFASINIYTQVGLITLIGLISKHGILIVQFANELQRHEGLSKREAIERAAGIRLRPILMTTGAMVLGVVPLLLATGPGANSRFGMGLVISTGVAIGTAFTLFVVPGIYMLLARDHSREALADTADRGD